MKKKRIIIAVAALLSIAIPAFAVFDEKDISHTLSVLRFELHQEYEKSAMYKSLQNRNDFQHIKLIEIIKQCNELSLILYSQRQDYTFDMTYALKTVTKEYEEFKKDKRPFDEVVSYLDIEIERYSRLLESLRRLPPQLDAIVTIPDSLAYHNDSLDYYEHSDAFIALQQAADSTMNIPYSLDSLSRIDRDSCIFYASQMLTGYSEIKSKILMDNEQYQEADARFKESYDYAKKRYELIQKNIFIDGQSNYFDVLSKFRWSWISAMADLSNKYRSNLIPDKEGNLSSSEWRGPMVFGFLGLMILYILVASVLSVFVVYIVRKKVRRFQSEEYKKKVPFAMLLCGTVIFIISIDIARHFIENNYIKMASQLMVAFALILGSILFSLVIRVPSNKIERSFDVYVPAIILGIAVIFFRAVFIPNSLINLVLAPALTAFTIWQLILCKRNEEIPRTEYIISWITFFIFAAITVMAWAGYVLMGIQIVIWWLFQLAAVEVIFAICRILRRYYDEKLLPKINERKSYEISGSTLNGKGSYITITWLFDLIFDAVIPVVAIMSVPLCLYQAADVFDLREVVYDFLSKPFFNFTDGDGDVILNLSVHKIVLVAALFFVFKYLSYAMKNLFHHLKVDSYKRKYDLKYVRDNEINFTLTNNVVAILVWGAYIILIILLLKIPVGALSIVAAGLATGIGLALKDVLNNFIYGIQLMSGRLRVGDWVECDGLRGKVTAISYQSTQIETVEGALVSYLNASLFDKNFKNLTRNNSYEFLKIIVGVAYGTDVDSARAVIIKALSTLQYKDMYGMNIVDKSKGITVDFDEFSDSSVDLAVKQYVLVSGKTKYASQAKEVIYKALNEAGIEIPFPQCDVNLKQTD